MTTNIGLVTSDAVVLGCDSIASASNWFIDPFELPWEKDANGKALTDADGKFTLKFDFDNLESVVTDSWGGVTKMFLIHPAPSPLVAVTTGLAKLNGRPIASVVTEFLFQQEGRQKKKFVKCDVICNHFLQFMRAAYNEHYSGRNVPDSLKEDLDFLVGGFGRDDKLPSMFRIRVKENQSIEEYGAIAKDGPCGLLWGGQADAVQRFMRGYDGDVRRNIESVAKDHIEKHSAEVNVYVADLVNRILQRTNQTMPDGIDISVPKMKTLAIDWRKHHLDIALANLPIQEAINLGIIPLTQVR